MIIPDEDTVSVVRGMLLVGRDFCRHTIVASVYHSFCSFCWCLSVFVIITRDPCFRLQLICEWVNLVSIVTLSLSSLGSVARCLDKHLTAASSRPDNRWRMPAAKSNYFCSICGWGQKKEKESIKLLFRGSVAVWRTFFFLSFRKDRLTAVPPAIVATMLMRLY